MSYGPHTKVMAVALHSTPIPALLVTLSLWLHQGEKLLNAIVSSEGQWGHSFELCWFFSSAPDAAARSKLALNFLMIWTLRIRPVRSEQAENQSTLAVLSALWIHLSVLSNLDLQIDYSSNLFCASSIVLPLKKCHSWTSAFQESWVCLKRQNTNQFYLS